MRKSAKEIIDNISSHSYINSTPFKFSKNPNRYTKGRMVVYEWVSELCFHFDTKEKKILKDFQQELLKKRLELQSLNDSEYKKGVIDSLIDVLGMLEKR